MRLAVQIVLGALVALAVVLYRGGVWAFYRRLRADYRQWDKSLTEVEKKIRADRAAGLPDDPDLLARVQFILDNPPRSLRRPG